MTNIVQLNKFSNGIFVKNRHYGSKECDKCRFVKNGDCPINCQVVYKKLLEKASERKEVRNV